jgi:hypothetical protein
MQSIYSSGWTENSPKYSHTSCDTVDSVYEIIQVNVMKSGCYIFDRNSSVTTYAYIYMNNFDPLSPLTNLLSRDNQAYQSDQFKIKFYLQSNMTYLLVVAKTDLSATGSFSIIATGSDQLIFERLSEYCKECEF